MRRSGPVLAILLFLLLVVRIGGSPTAAESPQPRKPGPDDVCPVCGMVVAPQTEWIAQVLLQDGSALFFDGTKDLFKYLLARDRFAPDKQSLDVLATFVTSYYDLAPIPARSAFFVVGSDVPGPMGAELVPHPDQAAADEFVGDHRGERVVRFDEVTAELLKTL